MGARIDWREGLLYLPPLRNSSLNCHLAADSLLYGCAAVPSPRLQSEMPSAQFLPGLDTARQCRLGSARRQVERPPRKLLQPLYEGRCRLRLLASVPDYRAILCSHPQVGPVPREALWARSSPAYAYRARDLQVRAG